MKAGCQTAPVGSLKDANLSRIELRRPGPADLVSDRGGPWLESGDIGVAEDDAVVEKAGVSMVVDAMSYPYLEGSVVDYVEDLSGSQFVVTNPNAASTCGCGNSFSI